jgi:Tfp pilus assembly protein PilO
MFETAELFGFSYTASSNLQALTPTKLASLWPQTPDIVVLVVLVVLVVAAGARGAEDEE